MPRRITRSALSLTTLALLVTGAVLYAGPLSPPVGPVTSTAKTLGEVEPRIAVNLTNTPGDGDSLFKITQPGSYFLTGNITGVANKHGIEIAANGVTLDLNGFDLAGIPGMGVFDGVSVTVTNLSNITVTNGSVRNWGDQGVSLSASSGFSPTYCSLTDVRATGNAGVGIAAGPYALVSGCSSHSNTGGGIVTSWASIIQNCSVSNNTGIGISGSGNSTITNCSAYNNSLDGINTSSGCTVSGCTVAANLGEGIFVGEGSTLTGCTARSNTLNGLRAGPASTISNCTAEFNTLDGILAALRSRISNCTCSANSGDGIQVSNWCTVIGNTCAANGVAVDGAGVRSTSNQNVIDGNNCTSNRYGIFVASNTSLIFRNICGANTTANFSIAATNNYGAIIDRTGAFGAAVNGNSAASSVGSTDPHANFSY